MAEPIVLDDPADPRFTDYTSLTDVALRRHREPAEGLFIAEGEKVIRRATAAGYAMRSMLLSAKWLDVMGDVIEAATAPVYLVTPALAEQVTGYHVHRGALAAMARKPLPAPAGLLAGAHRIAVFEDTVDHANLGAAFRNAAALGIDAVLLSPRCADPLYRRAVKVSMGTVFQIPWTRLDSWPADLELLRSHGFVTAALCLADDAITLDELAARRHEKLALLFGTEGDGLSKGALQEADTQVSIPMAAGVDSLNVAAASALAFYVTRR
ncbi:RNA methyltransferase [Streptomyces sp. NBC_01476]|uniref:TrmH family RNA methyltransferase n=1 Tax=Streptomyces sp. NBC_01476 TaxID=2903881 RepID=UPI002E34487B|nr:RNA methyltransferase [Streptomyces sp. NBC_01476]